MLSTSRLADSFHEWAVERGATHAITLTLGCYPERSFDPDVSFRPQLRKLLKAIAHDAHGVPKRLLPRLRWDRQPFMAGFYEPTTKTGVPYPHFHGVISVAAGEEPLMRGVLRTRWGTDDAPHEPAYVVGMEASRPRAARSVVRHPAWRPTFALRPLRSAGWASYSLKKPSASDRLWTSAELLA